MRQCNHINPRRACCHGSMPNMRRHREKGACQEVPYTSTATAIDDVTSGVHSATKQNMFVKVTYHGLKHAKLRTLYMQGSSEPQTLYMQSNTAAAVP